MQRRISPFFWMGCLLIMVAFGVGQPMAAWGCEGGNGGSADTADGTSPFEGLNRDDLKRIMVVVDPNMEPPEMTRENIIALKKAFGPGVMTMREREIATRQMWDQWEADAQMVKAAQADGYHTIAKAAGYGAAIGGGIVTTIGSGGAAGPTITKIAIAGDALAAGAGSMSKDINDGKSVPTAMKNAVGPTLKKGLSSYGLSKINTGSKTLDGALGTGGGITYDEASSGAPNTAPPAKTIYAPMGGGFTGTGLDIVGKNM